MLLSYFLVMLKGEGKKNARSPLMGHAPKVPAGRRRSRRPRRRPLRGRAAPKAPAGAKRALSKTVRN